METPQARLARRIVDLRGPLDTVAATEAVAKLLSLEFQDRTAPVQLCIDSPGGTVIAALSLRDAMDELACPVATHCLGEASGVAAAILAHGARGSRTAVASATISLEAITSRGDDQDLRRTTALIVEMIARDSGTPAPQVDADHRANRHFDAQQAHSYGLIDQIER